MNVTANGTRQSLSWVFTAAAMASAKSSDAAAPQPGIPAATSATAPDNVPMPTSRMSAAESRQNWLEFLENPDTTKLKLVPLKPTAITYPSPAEQAAIKAQLDAANAWKAQMNAVTPSRRRT